MQMDPATGRSLLGGTTSTSELLSDDKIGSESDMTIDYKVTIAFSDSETSGCISTVYVHGQFTSITPWNATSHKLRWSTSPGSESRWFPSVTTAENVRSFPAAWFRLAHGELESRTARISVVQWMCCRFVFTNGYCSQHLSTIGRRSPVNQPESLATTNQPTQPTDQPTNQSINLPNHPPWWANPSPSRRSASQPQGSKFPSPATSHRSARRKPQKLNASGTKVWQRDRRIVITTRRFATEGT